MSPKLDLSMVGIRPHSGNVVSANELTSLSAMITHMAHSSGENEFRIERRLSNRFKIPNVKCLPSDQYDNAIRYLISGT
jgi:hypothetical protein